MRKLFVDADIILDLLLERKPFYDSAGSLFCKIEDGVCKGCTSTVVISNLHYLVEKAENKALADKGTLKLLKLFDIISVEKDDFVNSLNSNFSDFEDGAQYYASLRNNIDFIITRNIKDYRHSKIKVLSALEFIESYC